METFLQPLTMPEARHGLLPVRVFCRSTDCLCGISAQRSRGWQRHRFGTFLAVRRRPVRQSGVSARIHLHVKHLSNTVPDYPERCCDMTPSGVKHEPYYQQSEGSRAM